MAAWPVVFVLAALAIIIGTLVGPGARVAILIIFAELPRGREFVAVFGAGDEADRLNVIVLPGLPAIAICVAQRSWAARLTSMREESSAAESWMDIASSGSEG